MVVAGHHDSRGQQFVLGWKPVGAAAVVEYDSMGLVVINSKQVPNSVVFADHRLWLVGRESYSYRYDRLIPSFHVTSIPCVARKLLSNVFFIANAVSFYEMN